MPLKDNSTLNASGASRRRLIRALGIGAIASQVSLDWSKPAIRLGALPAHAQGTPADACVLSLTWVVYGQSGSAPVSYTNVVTADDGGGVSTLGSTTAEGSDPHTLTGSISVAENSSGTLGVAYTVEDSINSIFVSYTASCCTDSLASGGFPLVGTSTDFDFFVETQEAGSCTFPTG